MRRALITGITGQDGRYLSEFLAAKGYQVFGMIHGQNNPKAKIVQGENPRLELIEGDLRDLASLIAVLEQVQPDEVYNLAAISFVQLSFRQPELTAEVTGLGVLRMLEAIRVVGGSQHNPIRFYQASSSEMFGKVREVPQTERTPFHPRSPYGVAKVFGHDLAVNYREAYGIHASSGILFNHESLPEFAPVCVRLHGYIDILPVGELLPPLEDPPWGATHAGAPGGDLEVWDGTGWSRCTARTANYVASKELVRLHGRGGVVWTTPDHVVFDDARAEHAAETMRADDRLWLADQPTTVFPTTLSDDEARLLGILSAEGYVSRNGNVYVVCNDATVLNRAAEVWTSVTSGASHKSSVKSGFSDKRTARLSLTGAGLYRKALRQELYTRDGAKRVPKRILNAAPHLQETFLRAYNLGDGLRAGHGVDEFKSFRTTSPVLACGLVWLARTALGRRVSLYEQGGALGGGVSYLINLNSGLTPGNKGAHLRKPQSVIRRVERTPFSGWTYDLATESGRFAAGVGLVVVHNSPRRGHEFVTRKITSSLARIKLGLQDSISLGNLDSQRDWGYAGDYVEAMWLMLQQDTPDDYVIATGETHSVRDFLEVAFHLAGYESWEPHVQHDTRFDRPSEVDLLIGDAAKAKAKLGWQPRVNFEGLVKMMYEADLEVEAAEARREF
jgi:GDPmannose 4,6-dehydratase